jgi:hypothetical protein
MTYTEQYNQYVKECIKERPAFSGPYEDYYLEFDEWIDDYILSFVKLIYEYQGGIPNSKLLKHLLEKFKKEKDL